MNIDKYKKKIRAVDCKTQQQKKLGKYLENDMNERCEKCGWRNYLGEISISALCETCRTVYKKGNTMENAIELQQAKIDQNLTEICLLIKERDKLFGRLEHLNKPKIIRVPSEIKICQRDGKLGICNDEGQVILGNSTVPYIIRNVKYEHGIPCQLTPCKRCDLKPGDLASFRDNGTNALLGDVVFYVVIIDNSEAAQWTDAGGVRLTTQSWKHWYKVEPI